MFKFNENDLLSPASIEDIFKYCNHYDLFRYYIGDFTIGRQMKSPLRDDKQPSFAIFVKGKKILFNDFVLGGGDLIKFVQLRFGLSLPEAIAKIVHDSGLSDKFKSDLDYTPKPLIAYNKKIEYNKPIVKVKRRKWLQADFKFWKEFGIDREVLGRYRVSPIQYIFINSSIIKADKFAYCFEEMKDNVSTYTIYQPFSKTNKWFKSHDASVFYGWSQLPNGGHELIITKSMKDVMSIQSHTNTPTTALQAEKTRPKVQVIDELKSRFKNIYVFYDNDYENIGKGKPNWGRQFGQELCKEFGLKQVEIPDDIANKFKAKDFSDLIKNGGFRFAIDFLNNINDYTI